MKGINLFAICLDLKIIRVTCDKMMDASNFSIDFDVIYRIAPYQTVINVALI